MINLLKLIFIVGAATLTVASIPDAICKLDDLKGHPEDCTKFLMCSQQGWEEFTCPDGLEWNSRTNLCDWAEQAKCVAGGSKQFPQAIEVPIVPQPSQATSVDSTKADYKVVCYFTNWAWYRQGVGKYLPEDIDPDLCTHVMYGFAILGGEELTIKPHDSWADIDSKFYQRVTSLKSRGIKVLIAIGGWNDSAGDKYSRLVNNPQSRQKFINHLIDFISQHNFDGLDLDWEYPACWQGECNNHESDKQGFAAMVKELNAAFKPRGLLLSAAVTPNKRIIDAGYDVPAVSQYLDFINVMAYDYHGQWDGKTGHHAPLKEYPGDTELTFNTEFTINYWISQGADPKKLILGMPMYGQSFTLAQAQDHGLNAQTYGGGEAGESTGARGLLAYYEICRKVQNNGWTVVRDPENRIGPYAYSGNQWVGFDDQEIITLKSNYIKSKGLGGSMIWALDLDDFKNLCNCEPYPLLRAMNRVLRNYPGPQPNCRL